MNKSFFPGTSLRLSRLFDTKTHRSVIVAMDHGFGGAHPGLENPGSTLAHIISGEPDGVIVTPGTARNFQSYFSGRSAPAMVLSIDYVMFHAFPGSPDAVEEQGLVSSVEDALRLGADAIKILMIFGRKDPSMQARNFDTVGHLADKCHQWGLPVIVEPTTWGHRFDDSTKKQISVIRDMARIAFEFGADVVKSDYPLNPADFKAVAESCPVPLLVLGGTKKKDEASFLHDVVVLMKNGASGVTFGRNVWQHAKPERFIHALKHIVYNEDIKAALSELNLQ